ARAQPTTADTEAGIAAGAQATTADTGAGIAAGTQATTGGGLTCSGPHILMARCVRSTLAEAWAANLEPGRAAARLAAPPTTLWGAHPRGCALSLKQGCA